MWVSSGHQCQRWLQQNRGQWSQKHTSSHWAGEQGTKRGKMAKRTTSSFCPFLGALAPSQMMAMQFWFQPIKRSVTSCDLCPSRTYWSLNFRRGLLALQRTETWNRKSRCSSSGLWFQGPLRSSKVFFLLPVFVHWEEGSSTGSGYTGFCLSVPLTTVFRLTKEALPTYDLKAPGNGASAPPRNGVSNLAAKG